MNQLVVRDVTAHGHTIQVDFESRGSIRKFFTSNHFFAEYNLNLEAVPASILVIPFLSAVLPLAWANNIEVIVPEVDTVFLASLDNVHRTLNELYPTISFRGVMKTTPTFNRGPRTREASMLLFGGGIDALASYIRHRSEKPFLLTVHGTDIHPDHYQLWNALYHDVTAFSETTGAPLRTVRSNFKFMLDAFMLHSYVHILHGSWYARVMHGLALLWLSAPVAYTEGVGRVYLASTFTEDFQKPWGSDPRIDNAVAWSGTTCFHDGYELSRQQKIMLIADYMTHRHVNLPIHSCWTPLGGARACNSCQKCGETIIGLELAGLDPNNHGFTITDDTFRLMKQRLSAEWPIDDQDHFMWTDIQRHATTGTVFHPHARTFMEWLTSTEIQHRPAKLSQQNIGTKVLDFVAPSFKYMPFSVYTVTKRFLTSVRSVLRPRHTKTRSLAS
jgi:hypothetical protein